MINMLTLIFISFEEQFCWRVLSELIFIISEINLADLFFFSSDSFHYQTVKFYLIVNLDRFCSLKLH